MAVYAIYHPDGYMKVGKSDNPWSRFKALQSGSPYELELYALLAVNGDSRTVEKLLHECLSEYHHRGEWFEISKSHLKAVFEAEVKHEDSPATHKRVPGFSEVA
jgi:hypothetical protein